MRPASPGGRRFGSTLRRRGRSPVRWKVGVVSSNLRATVRRVLKIDPAWSDGRYPLVGFEDVTRHKPQPDALAKMIERLGLGPGDLAAYVGDHVNDLEACANLNAVRGTQVVPIPVPGGKCDWEDIVPTPPVPRGFGFAGPLRYPAF